MAEIKITTLIKNKPGVVFDLSRSIDLHKLSTAKTREEAIAGATTGLIGLKNIIFRFLLQTRCKREILNIFRINICLKKIRMAP